MVKQLKLKEIQTRDQINSKQFNPYNYFKHNAELYSVAESNICLRERDSKVMALEQVRNNVKGAMLRMVMHRGDGKGSLHVCNHHEKLYF